MTKTTKPRLAESERDLWKAIHQATEEYKGFGSVSIEVFGVGDFCYDSSGRLIRFWEIPDAAMYWKVILVYEIANSVQARELQQAIARDQCDIRFVPFSRHQDSKLLHSCSGLSFMSKGKQ